MLSSQVHHKLSKAMELWWGRAQTHSAAVTNQFSYDAACLDSSHRAQASIRTAAGSATSNPEHLTYLSRTLHCQLRSSLRNSQSGKQSFPKTCVSKGQLKNT